MKPAPFEYHRPRTLDEAVELMATLDNPKVLSGGQSLVPMMNFRYVMPDHIVDISGIAEISGISRQGDEIRIGAFTRQREIEFSELIRDAAPLFQAGLKHVGHRQTRNRGTIGGSLAHADPSAELPTVCLAHDAVIEIAGQAGRREVPMREFNLGFMTTAVGYDEVLAGIRFRPWRPGHGYSFQEFARRHGDFAIVGAAVLLEVDAGGVVERCAVALCGTGVGPVRLDQVEAMLAGRRLDDSLIEAAGRAAGDVDAHEDFHASAAYRQHLAQVLTMRALREAGARAASGRS